MQTVIVTNNAYDTILLVDEDDRVVSRWDATPETISDYIRDGANASEWNAGQFPYEFDPDEQETEEAATELRTIAAYGKEYGRNGNIDSAERRAFWGL